MRSLVRVEQVPQAYFNNKGNMENKKRVTEDFVPHQIVRRKSGLGMRTKGVIVGDFVTRPTHEGTWMITSIEFNYELKVYQARIIKVGDPQQTDHVDPTTLSAIKNNPKW